MDYGLLIITQLWLFVQLCGCVCAPVVCDVFTNLCRRYNLCMLQLYSVLSLVLYSFCVSHCVVIISLPGKINDRS